MAVNLAQKHSSKMDLVFTKGSYTDRHVNKDYDFDGVDTIHVYTPTTVKPSDYDRANTGDRYGGNNELQDTVATYQLKNDKSFKIAIDSGNYKQGAFAKKAGKVMRAEMEEQIIPLIDMDRFATAATGAKTVEQQVKISDLSTMSAGDAYTSVLDGQAFLDECKAPTVGRVIFMTPQFYNLVKKDITTGIYATGYNDKLVPRGFVGELDGMTVIKVPSSYFPEKTLAIIWQKRVLLGARQITNTRIITDSEFVDGSLLLGRFIYGSFVLEAKKYGVASIVNEASEAVSLDHGPRVASIHTEAPVATPTTKTAESTETSANTAEADAATETEATAKADAPKEGEADAAASTD